MDRSIKGGRKRGMKKRWVILLSNILSIILIAISLSGCKGWERYNAYIDPWEIKQQRNGFYYYLVDKDGKPEGKNHPPAAVTILGLVSEGKEREELVIPETLGGYPVRYIGYCYQTIGTRARYYGMKCKNIKKIIINHDCYLLDGGIKQFDGDMIINANVFITGNMYRHYESSEMIDGKYIAANNIQINAEIEKYKYFNLFCYEQANDIKYEAMGGNLRTFHTIVKDGCYLNLPQDPVRDGYDFAGWFKEEECLNEWNFDEDIVEEDITLYAKWIEV